MPKKIIGIALMTLAMLSIPMVDGIAKYLSDDYSPYFISWMRYLMASLLILPIGFALFGREVLPGTQLWLHIARTACLVISMTLYFVAISTTALAAASSAFFVGPLVATILGVAVLRERLTGRKIISLFVGLGGALIILRPDATLEPGIVLALGSGVFFGIYMVVTRMASEASNPVKTLLFQCIFGALLLSPQAVVTWEIPIWSHLPFLLALGILSIISHLLSITAFRYAQASTLAPLVYLELLGSTIIGYTVFDNLPGLGIWIGAAAIVFGGLLLLGGKDVERSD